eukprot:1141946-Pelagomonas_calceolata.AAC.6
MEPLGVTHKFWDFWQNSALHAQRAAQCACPAGFLAELSAACPGSMPSVQPSVHAQQDFWQNSALHAQGACPACMPSVQPSVHARRDFWQNSACMPREHAQRACPRALSKSLQAP